MSQSSVELFTVVTDTPTYWRITALDRFDGNIWSSLSNYRPAGTRLPALSPDASRGGSARSTQEFEISGLASIWLPAAYRPEQVEATVVPVLAQLIARHAHHFTSRSAITAPAVLAGARGPGRVQPVVVTRHDQPVAGRDHLEWLPPRRETTAAGQLAPLDHGDAIAGKRRRISTGVGGKGREDVPPGGVPINVPEHAFLQHAS